MNDVTRYLQTAVSDQGKSIDLMLRAQAQPRPSARILRQERVTKNQEFLERVMHSWDFTRDLRKHWDRKQKYREIRYQRLHNSLCHWCSSRMPFTSIMSTSPRVLNLWNRRSHPGGRRSGFSLTARGRCYGADTVAKESFDDWLVRNSRSIATTDDRCFTEDQIFHATSQKSFAEQKPPCMLYRPSLNL